MNWIPKADYVANWQFSASKNRDKCHRRALASTSTRGPWKPLGACPSPDREARGEQLLEVAGWLQAPSNLVTAVSKVEC